MNKKKEFLHHLRDTIILLGGEVELANLLKNLGNISASDIDMLRQSNITLTEATKMKLVNINRKKIIVVDK